MEQAALARPYEREGQSKARQGKARQGKARQGKAIYLYSTFHTPGRHNVLYTAEALPQIEIHK